MFTAMTGKKADPAKVKQSIALVNVHSGNITAQQLVSGFSRMFPCGWQWKASPYLNNSFLVKFPSSQKIDELKGFEYIGIPGVDAAVRVSKWNNVSMAKYKLYTVWVRITGIPETLLHYQGFCEAASLIGKVKEVDMTLYRQQEIVRVKVGVKDPRKIPAFTELNDDDLIYDIWFELEDIVEQGGPMKGGELVVYSATPSAPAPVQKQTEMKRTREPDDMNSGDTSKTPKNTEARVTETGGHDFVASQYALEKSLREELEEKRRNSLVGQKQANEVEDSPNGNDCDLDASMAENNEVVGEDEESEFLTQDPDEFARKVDLSTQRIKEIGDLVDAEMVKENTKPAGNTLLAPNISSNSVIADNINIIGGLDPEAEKIQARLEAQERIRKAKAKADIDEAARRRSNRNKKTDEVHLMEKCEDMARKRNLEAAPGEEPFPTVLNSSSSFISYLTASIGVSLGADDGEAEKSISVIKDLEAARSNLFLADKRKFNSREGHKESKLDSFDPKEMHDLLSDGDSVDDDDKELNDCIMQMASIYRPRRYRASAARCSVKPKVRVMV